MANVIDIEGIGEVYAQRLRDTGVASTETLLEQGATPHGRKELAEKTGISDRLILKWVNRTPRRISACCATGLGRTQSSRD